MIVERVDFIAVPVADTERARRFYEEALGFANLTKGDGFPEYRLGENVFMYLLDPARIGREYAGPHTGDIALRVADVAETRRELEERGVEFDGETLDSGACHMAFFRDPDGNQFMLHRRYVPLES